jgi:hypothetical protein
MVKGMWFRRTKDTTGTANANGGALPLRMMEWLAIRADSFQEDEIFSDSDQNSTHFYEIIQKKNRIHQIIPFLLE